MKKEKNNFNIIITLMISFCFILLIISEIFLFTKIEAIQKNQYKTKGAENKKLLTTLIANKKSASLSLAIAISQFESVQNALKNNSYDKVDLTLLSSMLNNSSDYKNIWIHIVDKDGISRYRSWTNKKNDAVLPLREDLQTLYKNPQILSTISVGIFDMTFKSIVPLYKESEFLGIVEIISHFASIVKNLQGDGIYPVILVNKKYTQQFVAPLTNLFIDEYYVANSDIPKEMLSFIAKNGVETFWNQSSYMIKEPYYISFHKEQESQGDTMATFVLFQKLDTIKSSQIDSFKNLSQLIIIAIFAISMIIILFFYYYLKRKEEAKTHQILQQYNEELEEKITSEIQSSRKKDMLLANQSKLVALGEMLGNIAHQWRQPLSAISTAASGLQIKNEYNILSKEEFAELTQGILNNTKYLSETIEDFRDFFKKDKEKDAFNVASLIKSSYNIIKALYTIKNIKIVYELDENIEYYGFKNELSQVFLNLFNNAKDALLQNNIEEKVVFIKLYVQDTFVEIEFHDNAGGVKDEINNKIFDPYFTTKHQTQGTGIGLFMSNEIITKHFNGEIYNNNSHFILDNQTHWGANFIIKLPLSN